MAVADLIEELKKYPQDMRVATYDLPHDDVEIRISHYESGNPNKTEEFDYVAIY